MSEECKDGCKWRVVYHEEYHRVEGIYCYECLTMMPWEQAEAMLNVDLKLAIGTAYWHGHTNGRVWGQKAISKQEIRYGTEYIEDAYAKARASPVRGET